jgi:hypothetical protein
VQIDQRLEGTLFAAAEMPVDRAFLVGLEVILVEAAGEIAADGFFRRFGALLAEAFGQPVHVLFKGFCTPDGIQEFTHPVGGVVLKPEFVGDRHDAVSVGGEGFVTCVTSKPTLPAWSVDQAGFVQAVAAHHATDGVGDQALESFSRSARASVI